MTFRRDRDEQFKNVLDLVTNGWSLTVAIRQAKIKQENALKWSVRDNDLRKARILYLDRTKRHLQLNKFKDKCNEFDVLLNNKKCGNV